MENNMPTESKKPTYVCIRERQVNKHEVDIAELKTRADFKDIRIDELKQGVKEVNGKLDKIDESLTELQRQSERDDFNIDTRVSKLENTQNVLKWVIGLDLTIVGTIIAVLAFVFTHLR